MAGETLTFLRELPKRFAEIGAVMPSSPVLARSMARPIRHSARPLTILEVGPGTGPVTKQILRSMRDEDTLLICEINRQFLTSLKKRLAKSKDYQRHRRRVSFFLGPVQKLRARKLCGRFDVIVSSLPFSNFTPHEVEDILSLYQELLAPNGTLTFFEYIGLRKIGLLVHSDRERERILGVDRVVRSWREKLRGRIKTDFTLFNLPPALTVEAHYGAPLFRAARHAK